jgi:glucose/arabinose dehydrogenase
MDHKRPFLAGALLACLLLSGCGMLRGVFGRRVVDTPAPTSIPLATALPGPTAAFTASPAGTAPPSEASPTPSPSPTSLETRPKPPPAGPEKADATPTPEPIEATPALATPTLPTVATSTAVAATPVPPTPVPPTRAAPPAEPIGLPPGFGISVYAQGLRGPRMMTLGPDRELVVAERGAGRIVRLPDRDGDGLADGVEVLADGLGAPSSMQYYADSSSPLDGSLYVGETTRVLRLSRPNASGTFQERNVVVDGLPSGGHNTRTVLFSPDWAYLYVSVGSSCNVCRETDPRRAAIVRYRPDGSEETIYAWGLRNAVGIVFRPGTDELWATNNGRDWLGDDQPPETVYQIREGDDAGWPSCHAGRIFDPEFGEPESCQGVAVPAVEMQAHSAPLGLTFYTGQQFPEEYRGDLYVAFHGSWNRSVPTGFKVVRIPMQNGASGEVYDFAAGWLREDGSRWGRPVDVLTGKDGSLFVSDDEGGAIYRIYYGGDT